MPKPNNGYWSDKPFNNTTQDGGYPQSLIKGLCGKEPCSCDQCRAARKADPDYQDYLDYKGSVWFLEEEKRTEENTKECARIGQMGMKGHISYAKQIREVSEQLRSQP